MTDSKYRRAKAAVSGFVNGIVTKAKNMSADDHAMIQRYLVILLILMAIVVFRDVGRYEYAERGGVLDTRTGEFR